MTEFVKNIIWNSVSGFVEEGTRTAGEFAGNALIKAGDAIESGGRGVGNSIEKKATTYGSSISGQTYQPSPKALPSTARKPVAKRSNSVPASSKPVSKAVGPTPIGASKYPGKNQVNGALGTTRKAVTGSVNGVGRTAGGVTGGATKTLGGVTGGAARTLGGVTGGATNAIGGVTGGGQRALTGATSSFKGPSSTSAPNKALPKPYPNANGLPKSNPGNAFPSSGSKTAVKPGQPKPFVAPVEQKKPDAKKPYPGTNTLPGQGSRTPVQQQRLKPLPRMAPQIGQGQKMQHISI